jgi:apolipoprotein N-acyltransferase
VYIFGLTAYLAGLSPNQLLFDTPLFAAYGVAIAVVAVPMLVAAMAYGTAPQAASGAAIAIAVVAALAGIVLARRTGRRWHERLWTS